MRKSRTSLYTFVAVFLSITAVGVVTVPFVLDYAQRIYFRLQDDVNARQAEAMSRFVTNRINAGVDEVTVIREFQTLIDGTESDRGYVCLIDQRDVRYLCHPNLETIGMEAKPNALFDRDFSGRAPTSWQAFLRRGESAGGLLSYGPNMPTELIHFNAISGTRWTVSSHENTARIEAEVSALRSMLLLGAVFLGLLLALPASFAARQVGRRNERQIEKQSELERQVLEAENIRKTRELEGARQLQLSMLPANLPVRDDVELAAYMQTATEVGGDYYDFDEADDGTLTVAIGDATGHGARAGTMVAATKSLFNLAAAEPLLDDFLRKASLALKRMGMRQLYMAFAIVRLRGDRLELAGAGMPPALIYRAKDGHLDVAQLKGAPLGSFVDFRYQTTSVELGPGDVVVLMSDGFPELSNPDGEPFGYDRVRDVVAAVATEVPGAIIDHLRETARSWADGRPADDDITFVVMKRKGDSREGGG